MINSITNTITTSGIRKACKRTSEEMALLPQEVAEHRLKRAKSIAESGLNTALARKEQSPLALAVPDWIVLRTLHHSNCAMGLFIHRYVYIQRERPIIYVYSYIISILFLREW